MPEHSETIHTPLTNEQITRFMEGLSMVLGRPIAAVSVERNPLQSDTWIVTTTTFQGDREVWPVPETKDATR